MADLFCSFLDFRSLPTNCSKLHLFLPSKHLPNSLVHSYNLRITNRKPLHLTFLSQPSSPEFDVISTHEYSDGSLMFRFGDPSEVVENVKLVEQTEKIEKESKEESNVVKVFDGDHEREEADESNSDIQSSQNISVVDREIVSGEKLLEGLVEIEKSSLANVAVLLKSSEMENNIARDEFSSILRPVSLEPDNNVSWSSSETIGTKDMFVDPEVEKNIPEDGEEIELSGTPSLSNQCFPNVSADSEDETVEAETENEIIEDVKESDSNELLSLPPQLQLDASLLEEAESENLQVSVISGNEGEIDYITIPNEIVKNGSESESDMIELTSVSPQLESESKLEEVETSNKIVEGFQGDLIIVEDGRGSNVSQFSSVSPQLGSESVLYEEMGNETVEEFLEDDGIVSPKMIHKIPQDLTPETERTTDDANAQISELLEASGNEVIELESIESPMYSEDINNVIEEFVLSSGAALLPHPIKALTGGEDAYFVTGQKWLGVADAVSQWSLEGTNPGVYAQELIRNCEKLVTDHVIIRPVDLLNLSVTETLSLGSSTILIAQVDGQALHVANVGDSGFIILRHGTVYRRSSPMLHLFHFPLQIARGDDPSHLAEFYQVDLEEEDVIVTATDGLLDNLYALEISSIVLKLLAADTDLEEIAEALARRAQEVGKSSSSRSPFADSAQAAGYVGYTGGKLDDVAVIVSVVKRRSFS